MFFNLFFNQLNLSKKKRYQAQLTFKNPETKIPAQISGADFHIFFIDFMSCRLYLDGAVRLNATLVHSSTC